MEAVEAMTGDIDIRRVAKMMVERHGDEAEAQASSRADKLLEDGDLEGRSVWLRIVDAIRDLLRRREPDKPPS